LGWEWGHAYKKICHELPTLPPARGHPLEAECIVDDRVFAGVSEFHIHIPELRKKKDGRWRTPTLEMASP